MKDEEQQDRDEHRAPVERSWAEQARESVHRAGHNRGAARDALINLFEREQCALTPQEIEERLGYERPVGRASIYRALELLHGLHLIVRVDIGDGAARYERASRGHEDHHHHLVCDRCGVLFAFDDSELEKVIHKLSDRLGFDAAEHEVTIHGACGECQ